MQKEYEAYVEQKEIAQRTGADREELKAKFRGQVIEQMGKERKQIEGEHWKLSKAFGFPVGMVKTFGEHGIRSVLDLQQEFIDTKETKANSYAANFLGFLTVRRFVICLVKR